MAYIFLLQISKTSLLADARKYKLTIRDVDKLDKSFKKPSDVSF